MQNHRSPDGPLGAAVQAWESSSRAPDRLTLTIHPDLSWAEPARSLQVRAEYRFAQRAGKTDIRVAVDGQSVALDTPVRLGPVTVDKPWGSEIWFTAMESRGESRVITDGGTLPISTYLALAPQRICSAKPMVLLKILDPHPQPVLGDLYFEVHDKKREVYVVTGVDARAWPDGRGRIRLGMNQSLRERYGDDRAFRHAYLTAVKEYESVRRSIDGGRLVDAGREASKRHAMERFTALHEVEVGDVVVVPTWLPHSLQHGVRVAEFQTPSYERYIISFAQRVFTQDHWDSDEAVANMRLDMPVPPPPLDVTPQITEIAALDEFGVWRVDLQSAVDCVVPLQLPYAVCMNVSGGASINGLNLGPEEACLVPASALPLRVANPARHRSITLIAAAHW